MIDKKCYANDYIYLANHSGVSMFGNLFGIVSVQHQSIYLLMINSDGHFEDIMTLGLFTSPDDQLLLSLHEVNIKTTGTMLHQIIIPGLKQSILSFLFRRAQSLGTLSHFYTLFGYFESLILWRMMFLDDNHILMKMGAPEHVSSKNLDYTNAAFFVIFSLAKSKVLEIFENNSLEFFQIVEKWDCGNIGFDPVNYISWMSNNQHAREIVYKQMYAVQRARNGGVPQSIKRALAILPLNPQSYSHSPYFDHSLFDYDEKLINSSIRLRPSSDIPAKFYCRKSGALKFKLNANSPFNMNLDAKLNSYILHPYEPFCITVQYSKSQVATVNIHSVYTDS